MAEVLHLVGPVLTGDEDVRAEAWVVGGQITFERPAHARGVTRVEGHVIPGLVDMHCHVGLDSGGRVDEDLAAKQALADRDAGTLLIRDAGSPTDTRFLQGRPDMPVLIRAGRFIARPKRYLRHFAREIDVADLPAVAADEARAGDGWIKLIGDWIDREMGADADLAPLWPDDVLAAGVAAAHAAGARATVHAFAEETIDPLLAAGIDCIEHGTGMTDDHLHAAAARGIPVVPTLLQIAGFDSFAAQADGKYPRFAARMRRMHARRHEQVRAMHEAGVTLLVGTDAGSSIGHGSLPAEAAEMVAAGVPAADVLAGATWRARDFLGAPGLTQGARADLVVLDDDPRQDITALARPAHIVLDGARVGP